MKENRTQVRFEVSLTARWEGTASNQNVRIGDLSLGGCYLDTILEVRVGETMVLSVQMPNGEWLKLKGVVAHLYPRLGFGVRFVNLDENQRRQIGSLLKLQNACPPESNDKSECCETAMPEEQIDLTALNIM